jgi:hypothetical protein
MEEIRADGLLQLQASMQDLAGPLRPREDAEEVRANYHRAEALFAEWSTPQIFALHRMAFAMMMTRGIDEPHAMPGYCLCNVSRQLSEQWRLYIGNG